MNLIYIFIGIILLFILAVLFVRINVSYRAEYKDKNFDFKLRIYVINRIFGKDLTFSKKEDKADTKKEEDIIPPEDTDNGKKSIKEFILDVKKILKKYLNYKDAFFMTRNKIRKKFIFRTLDLSIDYGDGNAHTTAVSAGGMWGFIYNVLGFVTKTAVVKKHSESINPRFNQKVFSFRAEGIFATRVVHIIYAIVLFKSNYRKILKSQSDKNKKGV